VILGIGLAFIFMIIPTTIYWFVMTKCGVGQAVLGSLFSEENQWMLKLTFYQSYCFMWFIYFIKFMFSSGSSSE